MAFICDPCLKTKKTELALFVITTPSPKGPAGGVKRTAVCPEHTVQAMKDHLLFGKHVTVVSAD